MLRPQNNGSAITTNKIMIRPATFSDSGEKGENVESVSHTHTHTHPTHTHTHTHVDCFHDNVTQPVVQVSRKTQKHQLYECLDDKQLPITLLRLDGDNHMSLSSFTNQHLLSKRLSRSVSEVVHHR